MKSAAPENENGECKMQQSEQRQRQQQQMTGIFQLISSDGCVCVCAMQHIVDGHGIQCVYNKNLK